MKQRLIAAGAALAAVAMIQPYRPFVVSGTSMTPTFQSGQILLANIHPRNIERGDVVVFRHDDETMVKRVAYLPGDSIQQFFFAKEWNVPSSKLMMKSMIRLKIPSRRTVIPQGHVYVLADNPYGSIDSRTLGPIAASDVLAVLRNVDPTAEWNIDSAVKGSALVASL